MSDIRDMDSHAPVAVGQLRDGQGIIEVLGILGVYGESGFLTEILAICDLLGSYARVDLVSSFLHI